MKKDTIKRKLKSATTRLFASVFLVTLFGAPSFIYAAPFDSPREIALFADHLIVDGDYSRAINELHRYLKMNVPPPNLRSAYEKIITCLAKLKEDISIQRELENLSKNRERLGLTYDFWCRIANILEKEKNYGNAAVAYQICANVAPNSDISNCASLHQAKMLILSGQNFQALTILHKMKNKQNDQEAHQLMMTALGHTKTSKSPGLAMFLSALLPGSGHIYAGNPLHGVSSFVINLGLISAAYFSFENKSPILGSFITYVETGFYLGGIKTAARDARETNAKNKRLLRNKLLKVLTSDTKISLGKRSGNIQFVYRF